MSKGVPAAMAAAALLAACASVPAIAQPDPVSTEFTLETGHPRAPEQLAMRLDHADLAWRIFPERKAIEGVATLTFTATAPIDRLVLELDRRMVISSITVDGADVPDTRWSNPDGRLTIELNNAMADGQTTVVRIAYGGVPHEAVNAPWDGGFVWATAPTGEPWIATAVQGDGCDLFWPCIDHPQSEPALVDLHITVPSSLSAPANGVLLGVEDHGDGWSTWNWRARNVNAYAIALTVGPYVERRADFTSRFGNSIPMHYWHLRGDDPARVEELFAEFPRQLEWFERVIGPFPFADEKMGVVETPHLGMEHQTINAYGNAYAEDEHGYDWLLHHELAHEWFGNQMTNANWDDMWLHEGFGSYMQPLYLRDTVGERSFQSEMLAQRTRILNRHPVVSGTERPEGLIYSDETGPGIDIYMKGSHILHTLRGLIGDEAFLEATRRLVYGRPDPAPGNFTPRFATTPEFIAIVEQVSGRELDWFFDAYLYQAALPELVVERDGPVATVRWITPTGRVFPLPVEIEVDGVARRLEMAGGAERIEVSPGARILLDPHGRVLRRLEAIERFQAWQAEQAEIARRAEEN